MVVVEVVWGVDLKKKREERGRPIIPKLEVVSCFLVSGLSSLAEDDDDECIGVFFFMVFFFVSREEKQHKWVG